MSRTPSAFNSCTLSVLAAVALAGSADAALAYTTLQQASMSSTVTRYGSTGTSIASYTGPTTSSSLFSVVGGGAGNVYLATASGMMLDPGTSTYRTGDSVRLIHDVQASSFQANVTGSLTVQLSTAVDFHAGTFAPQVFSLGGSVLASGTRLEAGTYTLGFSLLNYSQNIPYNNGFQVEAMFLQPVAVPVPGAVALLGAAGLLGRRRRA
jgi:hypothetical protein